MFSQTVLNWNSICGLSKLLICIISSIQKRSYICLEESIVYLKSYFISFFSGFKPNTEFLSDAVAFEGIIIGLSIPISLQVVSWIAGRYDDHEISQFFIKEPLYKLQFYLILPNIAIAILLRFLVIDEPIILILIYAWLVINMFVFFKFIKLVEQYTTNLDKVMINKFKKYVEDILEE